MRRQHTKEFHSAKHVALRGPRAQLLGGLNEARTVNQRLSPSYRTVICALATAYAALVALVSWHLVRGETGWYDREVFLQSFELGQYTYLYVGGWIDLFQNWSTWYVAVDNFAAHLGGFESTLVVLTFVAAAIYAADSLSTSMWLLPLLFMPIQVDLFDSQIRSACAGALLIVAYRSDRVAIAVLLALIAILFHAAVILLLGLWLAATVAVRFCERGPKARSRQLAAGFLSSVSAMILVWVWVPNDNRTEIYSVSVVLFCMLLLAVGTAATRRQRLTPQTLFSLMLLLFVGIGGTLGLGTQRLLPLAMPVLAATFLGFPAPYRTISALLVLVAQPYWTVRWLGG